jgi:DNA helicase-2/ATP-dependent DNA helicase PcrA
VLKGRRVTFRHFVQALGYGNQIHNVLNILHKIVQQTGGIPSEEEIAQTVVDNFYLRYAADMQKETLRKSALRSVLRYVAMWQKDFTLPLRRSALLKWT